MDTQVREAIRNALEGAEYPMTAGELRRAVRSVGVFGEALLREQLVVMEQAGDVKRDQPCEKEFWYSVPPPWASGSGGESGTSDPRFDVRHLLDFMAAHDGREIDAVAVSTWTWQATHGGWTREAAMAAAIRHYSQDPPVCWLGTDTPRPLLPADINNLINRGG
jgi:hypothetical protein